LPSHHFSDLPPSSEARETLGLSASGPLVGTVGRLSLQKRHDVLIDAMASASQKVPNVELAILGDGELRDETAARAQIALGERARLLGHRSDVPSVLPALDVFAMSSDFEGLPFALLEAMAVGLPIVTTDVQGAGEAIRHEREGLLVPRRDPEALAAAIVRLLRDRSLAQRLGKAAKARFETEYTADRMVRATEAVYLDVLRGRRP
jgi:glycosyltransferase involved in cell wall biosynthesis